MRTLRRSRPVRCRAVQVGNEMDIYYHEKAGRPPHRNASYTEAEYEVEWLRFVRAYEEAGLPVGMIQAATYASASKECERGVVAVPSGRRSILTDDLPVSRLFLSRH